MKKGVNKQKIIKKLKQEQESKRNITFSLPESLLASFKKECDKHHLKMNQVVQKLLEEFIE